MARAATTPEGTIHEGDWAHYHGSLTGFTGHIMQVTHIVPGSGLTLTTATGGRLIGVRTTSVTPCGPLCHCVKP